MGPQVRPGSVLGCEEATHLAVSQGTGKTLLARACAAQTNACYLKLAGPSLVQVCTVSALCQNPY